MAEHDGKPDIEDIIAPSEAEGLIAWTKAALTRAVKTAAQSAAAADGTITAVAQTGPVEYRELVGYENAAQGYAVRVSDRTWLCCFNSFAMQTDGTTRLPYFYARLRPAGSSSLTALAANPFDTTGITLLSTDGEQMRFSYGGAGRWDGVRAVSGLDAATLILTEA